MAPPRSVRRPSFLTNGSVYNRRSSILHRAHAVEFDDNDAVPSAPPLNLMDQVSGYESVSFDAVSVPPPEDPPPATPGEEDAAGPSGAGDGGGGGDGGGPMGGDPMGGPQASGVARWGHTLSEQEARAALVAHVKRRCCYGASAARNMAITALDHASALQYTLETFTERRETAWSFSPYLGDEVDGSDNGPAPLPWELDVRPSQSFASEVKCQPVPHTSSVKQCHRCKGSGSILCADCHGKGWVHCISCHGNGYDTDASGYKERCFYCHSSIHGRGRQDCSKCSAKGKMACPTCEGGGLLLCFIQLTVTWRVNVSEHIVDRMSVPEDLVRNVTGAVAFVEEGARVLPIAHFPDETVNMASAQLLRDHEHDFSTQRILAQRHQVQVIPVTGATYKWKSSKGEFYVYGNEQKVYAPDYPQTCCCGCTIL
ncbi:protein SSUH2 homolog isoform X3 [Frankliniella occidentalis]|uniref:Protein SSUH2 homolog isoform X3 n=1 Tax=Frankliniella occidentalis TaxID=133901 RepID=A0A6J1RZ50_FRAOC|nr:protein SSUH2 homolog isoform X3 [Frankliniella occidentalis]XP_052123501.1 protein SSUH2 homolog isoform X3 [Frankliniella occidentalis]